MSELFSSLSSADYLKMMAETAILTYIIYKLYVAVAETRAKEIAVFLLGVVVAPLLPFLLAHELATEDWWQ